VSDRRDCVFCDIVAGEEPAACVYEDERTLAFMDAHPREPGHVLVIPRAHTTMIYDLDDETAAALASALVRVARGIRGALAPPGLSVAQSNGRIARHVIMHVHFHLIPRGLEGEPRGHTGEERAELAKRIRAGIEAAR
jgi:histidine triad (HIT) family protein